MFDISYFADHLLTCFGARSILRLGHSNSEHKEQFNPALKKYSRWQSYYFNRSAQENSCQGIKMSVGACKPHLAHKAAAAMKAKAFNSMRHSQSSLSTTELWDVDYQIDDECQPCVVDTNVACGHATALSFSIGICEVYMIVVWGKTYNYKGKI